MIYHVNLINPVSISIHRHFILKQRALNRNVISGTFLDKRFHGSALQNRKHSRRYDMHSNFLWIVTYNITDFFLFYFDGFVQERRNSSALAIELRLSCINPSTYQMHIYSIIDLFLTSLSRCTIVNKAELFIPNGRRYPASYWEQQFHSAYSL